MANWSQHHDLVYAFVCVSFLADGEVDESEKEAMRGNVKVMLPDVSDEEYNSMDCLLYTSPSPRDRQKSRMPSSA